jgi:hypothetical protein
MPRDCVRPILTERGTDAEWLARKMGITSAYLSLLLNGKRRWTDDLKDRAASLLLVPRTVLFFEGEFAQTQDTVADAQPERVESVA